MISKKRTCPKISIKHLYRQRTYSFAKSSEDVNMSSGAIIELRCLIAKYRVISEEDLKVFLEEQLEKSTTVCEKIMLDGQLHRLLRDIPLTVDERHRLYRLCRSSLPWWYRLGFCACECCLIFGVASLGYGIGRCICRQISRLWRL